MKSDPIFVKTAAGGEEIRIRRLGLPPRLRTMLLMVDGNRTLSQLAAAATALGAPADFILKLQEQGLVAATSAAEPTTLPPRSKSAAAPAPAAQPAAIPDPVAAPGTAEQFRAAQKLMNDTSVDALGLRGLFFTLKIEKAFTAADLLALLPEYTRAMAKAHGDSGARLLERRVLDLLA